MAGAVSPTVVKGDAVGIASVSGEGSDTKASVQLLQSGLTVEGKINSGTASRYDNQLVSVTSSAIDRLSLSLVTTSSSKGSLNVAQRKLGDRDVAENVLVYDRVTDGTAVKVDYDSLSASVIPQDKISFVSYDYAGRVKYLVLNDATGDAYAYGYLNCKTEQIQTSTLEGKPDSYTQTKIWVLQGDENRNEIRASEGTSLSTVRNNVPGGVALDSKGRVAATVTLQSLTGVGRSAFDSEEMTVTVAGVSYPVSDKVQCYNKTTKTWFKPGKEGMEAARAYSDDLTLYYDRAPAEGGKIRMIVVP